MGPKRLLRPMIACVGPDDRSELHIVSVDVGCTCLVPDHRAQTEQLLSKLVRLLPEGAPANLESFSTPWMLASIGPPNAQLADPKGLLQHVGQQAGLQL
jgi:hypothetical protein